MTSKKPAGETPRPGVPSLETILTNAVVVPEIRITVDYSEDQLQLLRDSIDAVGVIQPIMVARDGASYILIDGLHRLDQCRHQGISEIQAIVIEGGMREVLLKNIITNTARGTIRVSDMIRTIMHLWHEEGMDMEEIRKQTGLSQDYVEGLAKIGDASPSVLQALDEMAFGVSVARELIRFPNHPQQDEAVAWARAARPTAKIARAFVDEVVEQMAHPPEVQPQAPPAAPPPPTCAICSNITDPRLLNSIVTCPHCFGEVYRLVRTRAEEDAKRTVDVSPARDGLPDGSEENVTHSQLHGN